MRPGTKARARLEQVVLGVFILVPLLALVAAVPLAWGWGLSWRDVLIAFVMYAISGHGITVGFHRYFTHGAFKARKALRIGLAVAGSLAIEGPVARWVADHRRHHAYSDSEGDPHSPWRYGENLRSLIKGLWHAHVGWLFDITDRAERNRYAPDLMKDRGMRAIHKAFLPIVVLGLLIPFGVGWAATGAIEGALTALLWGGAVRIFLLHHVTFSINSVCHFFGRRRFDTTDKSTNVPWLSVISFGESWHHNHHAFPTSASHGLRWWELALDPGGLLIRTMEKLGLVWNVVKISPERQRQKALTAAAPAAAPASAQPAP